MIEKNKQLESLVNNKRVAVVGPSSHLVGKNIGNIIDKYDVVCKLNFITSEKHKCDYGERCDILFYNCPTLDNIYMGDVFKKNLDLANKIKLVVCPVVKALPQDKWENWDDDFVSPVVKNFEKVLQHSNLQIPFYYMGVKNFRILSNYIGLYEPNSGMMSIAMLLNYNFKELFITGISFYQQGFGKYDDVYFDDFLPQSLRNNNKIYRHGHNQNSQKEFFKKEIVKHNNVVIDSFLKDLLKINNVNTINI